MSGKKSKKMKEITLSMIMENPDRYIEINFVKSNRIIKTFYVYADDYSFNYKNKKYIIDCDCLILVPKGDSFLPTLFYKQGKSNPINFENKNKGIPSKILTLLYDLRLYRMLIQLEKKNINLFIVVLDFVILGLLGGLVYLLYNAGVI